MKNIQKSLANEELEEDDDYDEAIDVDDDVLIEGVATDTDGEIPNKHHTSSKREPTSSKNKSQSSQLKTRPSSTMTYHTQSSQMRKRKNT